MKLFFPFEYLNNLALKGLNAAGYGFSPDGCTFGIGPALLRKLKSRGYRTSITSFTGDFSHDSQGWADFYHNAEITTPQLKNMLRAAGNLSEEEFDQLYRRELAEMWSADFSAIWHFEIISGYKS